jgi:hypothetical protein
MVVVEIVAREVRNTFCFHIILIVFIFIDGVTR